MTVVTRILTIAAIATVLVHGGGGRCCAQGAEPRAEVKGSAESLFLRLGNVGLDASRIYHVRDAHMDRPGFYLTLADGAIGFTEDIEGRVTGAIFSGDGEVLAVPPDRAERASLALFTHSAVLEEKITFGYFRFNDETFADMQPYLTPAEDGAGFLAKWKSTAIELANADSLRLLMSFSNSRSSATGQFEPAQNETKDRFLHSRLFGARLGAFDIFYDSLAAEQVQILQLSQSQGTNVYDVWMSFNPRRTGAGPDTAPRPNEEDNFKIPRYVIQAHVTPPRQLEAQADCELDVVAHGQRAFLFELSRYLRVTGVEAEGMPVEFIHNPAIDGSQLARKGDDLVAVIFPRALVPGEKVVLKFRYGGEVLSEEANGLLSVGARGTWYPNHGLHMADFDLTFSFPAGWTLLATGNRIPVGSSAQTPSAEQSPGQQSRWMSVRPIPVAGFNLGRYVKASAQAADTLVEVYATDEMGLEAPKKIVASNPGKGLPSSSTPPASFFSSSSPARNVQAVADRTADALLFFDERFGKYPYSALALTQSPGPTSQGWPGLVFLSGYAFLSPEELSSHNLRPSDTVLARQTPVHEAAHQWWGDLVMWNSYRDQWISEGLASYCALLELESRDPAAFRLVLDSYRDDLSEMKEKTPISQAGAVTLGQRLNSSRFPHAYEVIAYGRGAWLFHMLREMLRDEQQLSAGDTSSRPTEDGFVKVLRRIQEKFAGRGLSTRELLDEFAKEWPKRLWFEGKPSLEWFYDGWIQGTSVPKMELKSVKFVRQKSESWATGIVVQRDAPDDLVTPVPIYAETPGGSPQLLRRVFADGAETPFRLRVPPETRRLLLDPRQTILRR